MFVSVNLCQARYQYASSIAPQHPESYGASQRLIALVLALRLFHRIPVPQGFDPLVLARRSRCPADSRFSMNGVCFFPDTSSLSRKSCPHCWQCKIFVSMK